MPDSSHSTNVLAPISIRLSSRNPGQRDRRRECCPDGERTLPPTTFQPSVKRSNVTPVEIPPRPATRLVGSYRRIRGRVVADTAAVASKEPPRYERAVVEATSFTPFEKRVRALLSEFPEMPATVLAERAGWTGSPSWFRANVARLRPEQRCPDPADRLVWSPGDAAQCDLWFPPKRIPLEDGTTALLPVLVIVPAYSRFICGRMVPSRQTPDLLLGSWSLIEGFGRVPRRLI